MPWFERVIVIGDGGWGTTLALVLARNGVQTTLWSAFADQAEELRGFELRIPASDLHPLKPGTYYTHDLVGCEVRTVGSGTVGEVTDVQFGSGAPLLVVGSGRDEVLVPMTDEICRAIDIVARVIVIDPPPGLLDLNRRS